MDVFESDGEDFFLLNRTLWVGVKVVILVDFYKIYSQTCPQRPSKIKDKIDRQEQLVIKGVHEFLDFGGFVVYFRRKPPSRVILTFWYFIWHI